MKPPFDLDLDLNLCGLDLDSQGLNLDMGLELDSLVDLNLCGSAASNIRRPSGGSAAVYIHHA